MRFSNAYAFVSRLFNLVSVSAEERVILLVIGGGGREHALSLALKRSPSCDSVLWAPRNGEATCKPDLDISDSLAVFSFCRQWNVGLVVAGPEMPLVAGLANDLVKAGILTFGLSSQAAALEGSNNFMKNLCHKYNIPTAKVCVAGEIVAINKVLQKKRYKNIELQIMQMLDHPNVVAL